MRQFLTNEGKIKINRDLHACILPGFEQVKRHYRIHLNKCRIWDKNVNKHRTPDALTADIFALVIMKLSAFFRRVSFSRNSRFIISVVLVHRKINI